MEDEIGGACGTRRF